MHNGMHNGAALLRRHRRTILLIIAAMLLLATGTALVAVNWAGNAKRAELRAAAGEIVAVQAQTLDGLMEKFRLLPNLVARYDAVADVIANPGQTENIRPLLQQVAALSGALDLALLTAGGQVQISARDLFTRAETNAALAQIVAQGRLARAVRPFGERGRAYVFAHGIRSPDGALTGIVAVMFDLGALEQVWSLSTNPVFVADQSGTILLSNQPARHIQQVENLAGGHLPTDQIDIIRALPQMGWTLHVLADSAPIAEAQTQAALIVAVLALAIAIGLIAFANRQLAVHQRQRRDRAAALRLERLVRDRTSDLTRTNLALADEVTHHKQTEATLRQTQTELIQTGKMAALGQMSTALSHEYSQPLAAAKSYADNAIQLLKRGRTGEVRENLTLISHLADRMAAISRHLRNFARKPNVAFGAVPIDSVIEDALAVLSARTHEVGAAIKVTGDSDNIWVRAGPVRLQQVMVNLIANALDASAHLPAPTVEVHVTADPDQVRITVRDFGAGIADQVIEQIFDPFFTTKRPGDGLGLGLSISFNIVKDFGGRLSAVSADPGAEFTLLLQRGDAAANAAE